MRFLVVTNSREAAPPEMTMGMLDAMSGWVSQWTNAGKMEQVWSFAGLSGGGGILNVDSLEELDAIMAGFPFGQISDVEIYGLADLEQLLQTSREIIQQMMAQGGGS